MYNPRQFDNSANVGPTALAVCLKSMVFLLMVVAIAGLGYWVWWLHQNRLAFPAFKVGDVVARHDDAGTVNGIGRVEGIVAMIGPPTEDGNEKWHWQYQVFFPAAKVESIQLESELSPAAADGQAEFESLINANHQDFREKLEIHRQDMREHFNQRQQWEQDGNTGRQL